DEIEKAHPAFLLSVMNLLDTGFITDNKGNSFDCRGLQIVLTSNLGADVMEQLAGDGVYLDQHEVEAAFDARYKSHPAFKPEIRNRIDTVDIANPLSKATQKFIINREVATMFDQLGRKRNMHLRLDDSVRDHLIDVGFDRGRGGRGVKVQMNAHLRVPLQEALQPHEVDGKQIVADGKWLNVLYGKLPGASEPTVYIDEMSEAQKAEELAREQAASGGT
ncbi:MAG TPA: AAA family ATPase, partial [Myxococcota bacterium]